MNFLFFLVPLLTLLPTNTAAAETCCDHVHDNTACDNDANQQSKRRRFTSLAEARPDLAAQYSPNNKVPADKISVGSGKKVLWICKESCPKCQQRHREYLATVDKRTRKHGTGCPQCAGKSLCDNSCGSLAIERPDLAAQYSPNNDLPADKIAVSSSKKVLWVCKELCPNCQKCHNEYVAIVCSRTKEKGTGCPQCAHNSVVLCENGCGSLAIERPDLAAEYSAHNELPADKIAVNSNKSTWWTCVEKCVKCQKPHNDYKARICDRTKENGTGCPQCASAKGFRGTLCDCGCGSLAIERPELAAEYSPNNDLPANKIAVKSHRKVLWDCSKCGKSWPASTAHRSNGRGCPRCRESKGEKALSDFCASIDLKCEAQKPCDGTRLKLDHYLPTFGVAIEFDGIFHFEPHWSDKSQDYTSLEKTRQRDAAKDEWCMANGVPLLRLHYDDADDFEPIVREFINYHFCAVKQVKVFYSRSYPAEFVNAAVNAQFLP